MKEIVIISGKGGTGKTFLTLTLAYNLKRTVLVDADVDASNLHFLFPDRSRVCEEVKIKKIVKRDEKRCQKCGKCEEVCRFEAITRSRIDSFSCEGCGACVIICSNAALSLTEPVKVPILKSDTQCGPLFRAKSMPGVENAGKIVARLKALARKEAAEKGFKTILIDGPPGTGCPVISSLTGANLAVIVTEPTPSGLSDTERVFSLVHHFGIEGVGVINKFDLEPNFSKEMKKKLEDQGLPIIGTIPFDSLVLKAIIERKPLIQLGGIAIEACKEIWEKIKSKILS